MTISQNHLFLTLRRKYPDRIENPQYYSPHYSDIETDLHSSEYGYKIINY